jgi:hypothetical protein
MLEICFTASIYVIVNTCIQRTKKNNEIKVIMIDNHKSNSNTSVLITVLPHAAKKFRPQCFSNGGKPTIALLESS